MKRSAPETGKLCTFLLVCGTVSPLAAQTFGDLSQPTPRPTQYVTYTAGPQTVPAGKPATLDLHFHVRDGYHVNSHTPKDELLLPTRLEIEPAAGIQLRPPSYPAGQAYQLPTDPPETLDVYTGDIVLKVPVTSVRGAHELTGSLHYQACDRAACYPPRMLPVHIAFTAQ